MAASPIVGIFGDAALEARRAVGAGLNFADQIEPRHLAVRWAAGGNGQRLLADFGDQADDHGLAGHQAHEFADGGTFAARRARVEFDAACEPVTTATRPIDSGPLPMRRVRVLPVNGVHGRPGAGYC